MASSSLNKTSVFPEKCKNRVTSPSNPPRRDLAPLLPLKLTQHGERRSRRGENSLQETLVILSYHSALIRTPPPPPYRLPLFFPVNLARKRYNKSQKGNNGTAAAHEYCIDSASQLKRHFLFNEGEINSGPKKKNIHVHSPSRFP